MGRHEKPIDRTVSLLAALADDLRELRRKSGKTYAQMATQCELVSSTLSQAANGTSLPSWETVTAYVTICGEHPVLWRERYLDAQTEHKAGASGRARPAAEATVVRLDARRRTGNFGAAPVPFEATTIEELFDGLDTVRTWAGQPSLREIARRSGNLLPATTLHYVLANSHKLPSREHVMAFLVACGIDDPTRLRDWSLVWERVANNTNRRLRNSGPRTIESARTRRDVV